ncbi:hypothetical protein [Streptomyces sp. NRRL F-2664]|uniref:hypothetical protein n=1 Tax=Streptomyces sp. NRRL F-2664 TaxID=1463842 RepID=UPI0004C97183|nr:hypothetical protein [Streptomyces sp. NRRL F-2664]
MRFVRADDFAGGLAVRDVAQDRDQVVVGEAAGRSRQAEGLVDFVVAQDGGQLNRAGRLGADPVAPAGPASLSQRPAPRPMPTNAISASERGCSRGWWMLRPSGWSG